MNRGILIFAHNSATVDYSAMALIAGGLATKNLKLPATLITDANTVAWLKDQGKLDLANSIFENIIEVERPQTLNKRRLHDVDTFESIPFINANRLSAWDLTPYDETLLIDSDYLIFTDNLNSYWDQDADVMISSAMNDIRGDRAGILDTRVSEVGVHLYWATTVMFKKNEKSKLFFSLVENIRNQYKYYSEIYKFNPLIYRNDISFSVAKHILDGYETDLRYSLPPILTTIDKDELYEVGEDGNLVFLVNGLYSDHFSLAAIKDADVHVMNKHSLLRNADKLARLI